MVASRSIAIGRWIFVFISIVLLLPVAMGVVVGVAGLVRTGLSSSTVGALLGAALSFCIWWYVWDGSIVIRRIVAAYAGLLILLTLYGLVAFGAPGLSVFVYVVATVALAVVLNTRNAVTRYLDARRARFVAEDVGRA